MPYTEPLNPATPADGDLLSQGDDSIRQLKRALIERLLTAFTDVDANPLVLLQAQLVRTNKRRFSSGDWVVADNSNPPMTRSTFNIAFPAGAASILFIAVTELVPGTAITHLSLKGTNSGAGGGLSASFYRTTAAGVTTTLATLNTIAGGGVQTITAAIAPVTVAAGEIYGFIITVNQIVGSTIGVDWVEVDPL